MMICLVLLAASELHSIYQYTPEEQAALRAFEAKVPPKLELPKEWTEARPKLRKGTRSRVSVHPSEQERPGHVTALQLHRILVALQTKDPRWDVPSIAAHFDVPPIYIDSLRRNFSVPYIDVTKHGDYEASRTEPKRKEAMRALGDQTPATLFGEHLKLEVKKSTWQD